MEVARVGGHSWQLQKLPYFSSLCLQIWIFLDLTNPGVHCRFSLEGSGHLALIAWEGGESPDPKESHCCLLRNCESCPQMSSHHGLQCFFHLAWFFICRRVGQLIEKWEMQLHFLMFLPCHCIAKIAINFVWRSAFENQMLRFFGGMDDSIFMVMGKLSLVMLVAVHT